MNPRILFRSFPALAAMAVFAAGPALAHTIDTGPGGLAQGFAHPFLGLDHVLAMLAVGLWAAHLGGPARWLVPASFVAAMALAGGSAMAGLAVPGLETAIALTVAALGGLILARARVAVAVGMAAAAGFAVFHGLAHGLEAPAAAGLGYGMGFVAATALLHGLGLGGGLLRTAKEGGLGPWVSRLGGGTAVAAGLALAVL